jgi:hypothetical protein
MKKPLLCVLGFHLFGMDGEAPDPVNTTRRCSMAYCSRSYFCNKRRVNGKVVTIPAEFQAEREERFSEKYVPLPPASREYIAQVNKAPRISYSRRGR